MPHALFPAQRAEVIEGRDLHELSICGALMEQVTALAVAHGARCIRRITVEVGPLSGVDAGLLRSAFDVMRAGSCAAAAVLAIDTPDVRIRCNTCDAISTTAPNRLVCRHCGGFRARIVQGDELRLRRVEMDADARSRPDTNVGSDANNRPDAGAGPDTGAGTAPPTPPRKTAAPHWRGRRH
jgi:hydrogenase nickel incorporation protein HypA/HybF